MCLHVEPAGCPRRSRVKSRVPGGAGVSELQNQVFDFPEDGVTDIDFGAAIRHARGIFCQEPNGDWSDDERLKAHVAVWDRIKVHFIQEAFAPKIVLLGVEESAGFPPIMPWLEEHFRGSAKRNRSRVELPASFLNEPAAMDLLTNLSRILPFAPSGQASSQIPRLVSVVVQLQAVTEASVNSFLDRFDFGGVFASRLGSFHSGYRTSMKTYVAKGGGRLVIHPTMSAISNIVGIYADGDLLDRLAPDFLGHVNRWRAHLDIPVAQRQENEGPSA